LKNKIKELIATFVFDEVHELNKNDSIIKESRFISSIIIETKLLHQFDTEVKNAEVDVKINVKKQMMKYQLTFSLSLQIDVIYHEI